jgi:hypothetical protein
MYLRFPGLPREPTIYHASKRSSVASLPLAWHRRHPPSSLFQKKWALWLLLLLVGPHHIDDQVRSPPCKSFVGHWSKKVAQSSPRISCWSPHRRHRHLLSFPSSTRSLPLERCCSLSTCYSTTKTIMSLLATSDAKAPNSLSRTLEPFVCGGSAATFASVIIHPIDLAKVRFLNRMSGCSTTFVEEKKTKRWRFLGGRRKNLIWSCVFLSLPHFIHSFNGEMFRIYIPMYMCTLLFLAPPVHIYLYIRSACNCLVN